jgi:starch synthase
MNVLFISAEADPFAKVGGLADVVGSLPKALKSLGADARVIMPDYGFLDKHRFHIEPLFSFQLTRRTGTTDIQVSSTEYDGVPFYFIRGWPFFGTESAVYSQWDWDAPRFIFFCQAVMAAAKHLRRYLDWFPDLLHVNDWHTGLVPFLLEENRGDPLWSGVGSLLSIHNMAYQGDHVGGWLWQLGIPGRHQPDLVRLGQTDNMLAMAMAYSDFVTTVSPRYAVEIQYPYMGYGLNPLARARLPDLFGILNGIDTERWNPETDPLLVSNYNAENFQEKRPPNKRQLQIDTGLEVRDDIPLIGVVSRLVEQKGFDLAIPALRQLLSDTDVQVVALGTGEPEINEQFWRLGEDFRFRARVFLGYNASVAQHIYGGCDLFLMPSRYEPCGVGQMLAMRYGALPVVRETGGLADTVSNYDDGPGDRGTGFVFNWVQSEAVLGTLRWALRTYRQRPDVWQKMQARAMNTDFSWKTSAQKYLELYIKAVNRHKRKGRKK